MEESVFKDKRFRHVVSNPRFKNIPRNERKVKIDKRFQSMFTDKRFQVKYTVDERGRQVNELQSENYKKYYDISDSSDQSDSDTDEEKSSGNDAKTQENNQESIKDDENNSNKNTALKEESNYSDDEEPNSVEHKENEESLSLIDENKTKIINDDKNETESIADKNKLKEKLKEVNKYVDEIHKTKLNEKVRERLTDITVDYARGIGTLLSDSESSSDEPSSDESDSEVIEHPWGELDKDAEETEEISRRLAVCNMDWDRVTAKDLMVLFHSFLPPDGIIESVTIYPSEFGLERMAEEELKGPKELVENKDQSIHSDEEIEEGSEYQREKLREYQLKRLKYYYAVIVCNSEETANTLYTECDGIEYESSAMKLDLRFIADDITFDQKPHDVCTTLPDLKKYKPRLFINTALQQGKVDLTWDETDPNRIDFTRKVLAGEEVDEEEVQAYLASSSSSDEEDSNKKTVAESDEDIKDDNERILKYRALMSNLQEESDKKKGDVEMEVTWGPDSTNKDNKDIEVKAGNSEIDDDSSEEVDISSADSDSDNKKSKMKKVKRNKFMRNQDAENNSDNEKANAELELLLADDNPEETGKKHFSLKAIQKEEKEQSKKKKWRKKLKKKNDYQEEDAFKIDTTDNRFSALFTSHHFNIDPADPHFRKTKAMNELISEKQKRRKLES